MKYLIALLVMGLLTNNFVLSKFYGICPFLGVSKKLNTAVGMSAAVIFVMLMATAATYPINQLLVKNDLAYLQTVVFILVIAALVQMVEIVLKKYIPSLYNSLGIYLPLITTNCAVLGVTINNITDYGAMESNGFLTAMVSSLGCGLGFLLAMVLFSGMRQRIEESNIPESFKGLPVTLIAASFISLAFFGFAGIVDNLFA